MNIYKYMNMLSEHIINCIESKEDIHSNIEFNIIPFRNIDDNKLSYAVEEKVNFNECPFYCKIPCQNKQEFYESFNNLLINYFKNSGFLMYTAIRTNGMFDNVFSIVTNNKIKVSLGIEDEIDKEMFLEFKKYLDERKPINEEKSATIIELEEYNPSLKKTYKEVKKSEKIML